MTRILVCGSRAWENPKPIRKVLQQIKASRQGVRGAQGWRMLIIIGGAPGVDTIAEKEAKRLGLHVARIDALWDYYERSAGPIRNGIMLSLKPSLVLAFHWDIENESKGTKNCLEQAKSAGIRTKLVLVPKEIAMPSGQARKSKKA